MNWKSAVLTTFFIFALQGCGPQSYDECILKNMRGASSNLAANTIRDSCRKINTRPLTSEELSKLAGRLGGLKYGDRFGGSIYNGNSNVEVTQMDIAISTVVERQDVTRSYTAVVTVSPQATEDFAIDIIAGDANVSYEWTIVAAKGFEK